MQENNSHLGSPKVRSKKRTTMADFNKGFDELTKQNQQMSLHIHDADKQMKLMRLAVLAFDNKKGLITMMTAQKVDGIVHIVRLCID